MVRQRLGTVQHKVENVQCAVRCVPLGGGEVQDTARASIDQEQQHRHHQRQGHARAEEDLQPQIALLVSVGVSWRQLVSVSVSWSWPSQHMDSRSCRRCSRQSWRPQPVPDSAQPAA